MLLQTVWVPLHLATARHLAVVVTGHSLEWQAASLLELVRNHEVAAVVAANEEFGAARGSDAIAAALDIIHPSDSESGTDDGEPHIAAAHKTALQPAGRGSPLPIAAPAPMTALPLPPVPGATRSRQTAAAARRLCGGIAAAPSRPRAPPTA